MGWPTIYRYSAVGISDGDLKILSADLVSCGSRTSAATPDIESVIRIRSFGQLEIVSVCLAGIPPVRYCRQSLSESFVCPVGRVGRRSDQPEDKSMYGGQSVYPNKDHAMASFLSCDGARPLQKFVWNPVLVGVRKEAVHCRSSDGGRLL